MDGGKVPVINVSGRYSYASHCMTIKDGYRLTCGLLRWWSLSCLFTDSICFFKFRIPRDSKWTQTAGFHMCLPFFFSGELRNLPGDGAL